MTFAGLFDYDQQYSKALVLKPINKKALTTTIGPTRTVPYNARQREHGVARAAVRYPKVKLCQRGGGTISHTIFPVKSATSVCNEAGDWQSGRCHVRDAQRDSVESHKRKKEKEGICRTRYQSEKL